MVDGAEALARKTVQLAKQHPVAAVVTAAAAGAVAGVEVVGGVALGIGALSVWGLRRRGVNLRQELARRGRDLSHKGKHWRETAKQALSHVKHGAEEPVGQPAGGK